MELIGKVLFMLVMFLSTLVCFVYWPDNPNIVLLGKFGIAGTFLAFIWVTND